MTTISPNVQAVLQRARDMSADGKNTNKEVGQLVAEIVKLDKSEQAQLTTVLEGVRDSFGGLKDKEPLEAFLSILRSKPSQLIAGLEKAGGTFDLGDALKVAAQLWKDGKIDQKEIVSVRTMMMVSKMEPAALAQMQRIADGRGIDVDSLIRPMLTRGMTGDDVRTLSKAVGKDEYGSYELAYWAQTTRDSDFKPGAKELLHSAAAAAWPNVTQHYREDLELNRNRQPSPRALEILGPFLQKTLGLDVRLTLDGDRWKTLESAAGNEQQQTQQTQHSSGNVRERTFSSNDELAAFFIARALREKGVALTDPGVSFDKRDSKYVLQTPEGERRFTFHSELLREHGYRV